jgi:hypothetical protein
LPSSQITSIRSILMLFFQLILVLQSGRFPKDFRTRILYAFLFSSNLATRSVRHSLVDFTIVPLLGYQHKSWRYSFYNILSCSLILSFFHPNIFLHALFWNTCNFCYFPKSNNFVMQNILCVNVKPYAQPQLEVNPW